jgi:hypothetical protein
LDHLVSGAADIAAPNRTDKRKKSNQFPICIDSDDFAKQVQRGRLCDVPDILSTFIEGLQPYSNGKRHDLLWLLAELTNFDKHRALPVISSITGRALQMIYHVEGRPLRALDSLGMVYGSGYILTNVPRTMPQKDVEVEVQTTIHITLDESQLGLGLWYVDAGALFQQILERVANIVVPGFEPFF